MGKIMKAISIPFILIMLVIETLIKIVWGIVFYTFKPIWKRLFVTDRMEDYTKFSGRFRLTVRICNLWEA